MPRGVKGLAVIFTVEIIIFLKIMELNPYFYGASSREKRNLLGKK